MTRTSARVYASFAIALLAFMTLFSSGSRIHHDDDVSMSNADRNENPVAINSMDRCPATLGACRGISLHVWAYANNLTECSRGRLRHKLGVQVPIGRSCRGDSRLLRIEEQPLDSEA